MKKRPSREIRNLARRTAEVAANAPLDGLDAARGVMAAAIHVSLGAQMTHADIADWLRRLAKEMDDAAEAQLMRQKNEIATPS